MTTSSSNRGPGYFQATTGDPAHPLWILRVFSAVALIALLFALFVWKSGGAHDFCVGLAAGTLTGLLLQTFAITRVEINENAARFDVDSLSVTLS